MATQAQPIPRDRTAYTAIGADPESVRYEIEDQLLEALRDGSTTPDELDEEDEFPMAVEVDIDGPEGLLQWRQQKWFELAIECRSELKYGGVSIWWEATLDGLNWEVRDGRRYVLAWYNVKVTDVMLVEWGGF